MGSFLKLLESLFQVRAQVEPLIVTAVMKYMNQI